MTEALARAKGAAWQSWAFGSLLLGTGLVYLVFLDRNGWSNAFYAAAAQAGSQSWEAFLFGASDAPGTITVDKPPASLWPMALSIKLFGLSTWSLLVPQVLLGVASVGLLAVVVRRSCGANAGLIAGLVFATTPIALAMFRHDNPEALLLFLEIAATGAMLEAVRSQSARQAGWWLFGSGALVGFAFLTKQLAAFLILPGLALVWLVAGAPKLLKRFALSFVALAGLVLAAGWWVALVELWSPKDTRPWVGGSEVNSFLDLTFGFNGLGRISGDVGGGRFGEFLEECGRGGRAGFTAERGALRMFTPEVGGQVSWLLPAALVLLVFGLVVAKRSSRADLRRASFIAFGGWLIVTAVVFSFMQGTFHPYYSAALAPAVAALIGGGLVIAWETRRSYRVRAVLATTTLITAGLAWFLLERTPRWSPWLKWGVLVLGIAVALGWLLLRAGAQQPSRIWPALAVGLAAVGLAGPVAYDVNTVLDKPITDGMPSAGPQVFEEADSDVPPQCDLPTPDEQRDHDERPHPEVVALLRQSGQYTWAAATIRASVAAPYQLDSGQPVMPIGGFSGRDPWPTLERFQQLVGQGAVHYFFHAKDFVPQAFQDLYEATKISDWVEANFAAQDLGGDLKLYDLTKPLH